MSKKPVLLALIAIVFSCRRADKDSLTTIKSQYKITGEIKGLRDSTWIYLDKTTEVDSSMLIKGRFSFTGTIAEKAKPVVLGTKGNKLYKFFWLETNPIRFTADSADFKNAKVTGSATEEQAAKLDAIISKQQDTVYKLSRAVEKISDEKEKAEITAKIGSLEKYIEDQNMLFVENNGGSLIAVDLLNGYSSTWGKKNTQYLYNKLSESNKNSKEGKDILEYLTLSKDVSVGKLYANFIQYDAYGREVELSDYIGKPLLIEFWASWCIPCRVNNSKLLKIYNSFHNKGFEIIGVSTDETKANWLKAIKDDGLTWKQLSERDGGENKAAKIYNINKFPTNFLIDKDGKIIGVDLSNEELVEILNKLI